MIMNDIKKLDTTLDGLSREVQSLMANIIAGLGQTNGVRMPPSIEALPPDNPRRILAKRRLKCWYDNARCLDADGRELLKAAVSASMLLLSGMPSLAELRALLPFILNQFHDESTIVDVFHFAIGTNSLEDLTAEQRWELFTVAIEDNDEGRIFDDERIAMGLPPRTAALEGVEHTADDFWVVYEDAAPEQAVREMMRLAAGFPPSPPLPSISDMAAGTESIDDDTPYAGESSLGYMAMPRPPWEKQWHRYGTQGPAEPASYVHAAHDLPDASDTNRKDVE